MPAIISPAAPMADASSAASVGAFRKLAILDKRRLTEHLLRLDRDSLRMRFGATLSPEALVQHAERCFTLGCTMHGYFVDGDLRGVAELRLDRPWLTQSAEAAFSVEPGFRDHGVATELFARTLRTARNRGVRRLMISCLTWNKPMQALARKFKAEFHWEEGEVVGTVIAESASPRSFIEELTEDALGYLAAAAQRRLALFNRAIQPS
ncbi:MAG: GNAT family N-acetyltransferase [Beijerinckiaceae bacterium]|nr:GNAT family N-acetyltransferase [Beijerinckiaceae bacterium]